MPLHHKTMNLCQCTIRQCIYTGARAMAHHAPRTPAQQRKQNKTLSVNELCGMQKTTTKQIEQHGFFSEDVTTGRFVNKEPWGVRPLASPRSL